MAIEKIKEILEILYRIKMLNDDIAEAQLKKDGILVNVKTYEDEIERIGVEFEEKEAEKIKKHKKLLENENKVVEIEDHIRNLESSIPTMKTNDEYFKLQDKVNELKEEKNRVEDNILALMEENEEYRRTFKELEVRKNTNLEKINKEIAGHRSELENLEKRLEIGNAEKAEKLASINPTMTNRYNKLEQRFTSNPIVYLNGETCTGCNMGVPPQVRVNIKMMDKIEYCQNCGRILLVRRAE